MQKIILLRHGKVNLEHGHNLTLNQFHTWVKDYDRTNIKNLPENKKEELYDLLLQCQTKISSTLPRSIQTLAQLNCTPCESDPVFNEAALPKPKGTFLRFSSKFWLIVLRVLWILGYSKDCESYTLMKERIKHATKKLILLSKTNQATLLSGHGITNYLIKKELLRQNWMLIKHSNGNHWDYEIFEYQV